MEPKSIFGTILPEFSAEYDLKRFDYEMKVDYPVELSENDLMESI